MGMPTSSFENLRRLVAEESAMLAEPIDFDALVAEGLLTKHGRSYYARNIQLLPDHVAKKIASIERTSRGIKLSFRKVTKSIQNLAKQTASWRGD